MATARLKAVDVSPTTLQYQFPKQRPKKLRPLYQRKFFPNEDAKHTLSQPWLKATDPAMPPYPYGKNYTFEEANHGLYGGAVIQSGHKISDGRNKSKTLRKWYPNVKVEKLKSNALNVEMDLACTARVVRTIKKCGGLDEYLLGEKPARLKELGLLGWKLRWLVLRSQAVQDKHEKERKKLGLKPTTSLSATFPEAWADPDIRKTIIDKMSVGWQQLKTKDDKFQRHIKDSLKWKEGNDLLPLRALDLYDPTDLPLPEAIEEANTHTQVPEVQAGFGILEVRGSDGEYKGVEQMNATSDVAKIAAGKGQEAHI